MADAAAALKGPFIVAHLRQGERPFQGQMRSLRTFPGLRPGLTEPAFQAEKSFTALPSGTQKMRNFKTCLYLDFSLFFTIFFGRCKGISGKVSKKSIQESDDILTGYFDHIEPTMMAVIRDRWKAEIARQEQP